MVFVPFFVDRSVVRKTEPTVFVATPFAYYKDQHCDVTYRQYCRLTCNMITTACLLGRSAAARALFSSLFEVSRSGNLSTLLGGLALRSFLAT